jgi:predicted transglutaminase-like cysteine proteinase
MLENKNKTEMEKLQIVNTFWNKIPYKSDMDHWGVIDYWATPAEMLATNAGDCEDYAIGKYFTLIALGVDPGKLKITYVIAINEAHMVLTYYSQPDAVPLVLDNLIPQIRPADRRPDLRPVYAFNGDGMWVIKGKAASHVGNPGKIRFWRELLNRMGNEFKK